MVPISKSIFEGSKVSHLFRLYLMVFILITSIFLIPIPSGSPEEARGESNGERAVKKEWTVLIYMAADNDLEDVAILDFNEMEMVGSSQNLNIVVQFDRKPGHDTSNGNWNDTRRFLVQQDFDPNIIKTPPVNDSMGELDMSDPDTLRDFLEWGTTEYPAERYVLVLWDHGNGLFRGRRSGRGATRGFLQDWTNGDDLEVWEISGVVGELYENNDLHFEIIAADVCYFGFFEIAYQFKEYTDYVIGSSDEEPAAGWDYQKALSFIAENPYASSRDVAKNIVERYLESYDQNYITQMAIDVELMEESVIRPFASFSKTLISNMYYYHSDIQNARSLADTPKYNHVDLYSFVKLIKEDVNSLPQPLISKAEELMVSLKNAVIAHGTGSNHPNSLGLGVWFPEDFMSSHNKNAYLDRLDFAYLHWDEVLREFDSPTPVSILHKPLEDTEDVDGPYIFRVEVSAPPGSVSQVILNYTVGDGNYTNMEFQKADDVYEATVNGPYNNVRFYYYIRLLLADNSTYYSPADLLPKVPDTFHNFWIGLDLSPPKIIHFPNEYITTIDTPYQITATVSDNMGVDENKTDLFYMINSTDPDTTVNKISMKKDTHSTYTAEIPAMPCNTVIYYWFETRDLSQSKNTARLPVKDYFQSSYVLRKKRLLIDNIHGNSLNYNNITQEYLIGNFEVKTLTSPPLSASLDESDLFITAAPTQPFSATEMNALSDFIEGGNSILVVGAGNRSVTTPLLSMGEAVWRNGSHSEEGNTTKINHSLNKFDYVDTVYYNNHTLVIEGGDHPVLWSREDELLSVYSEVGNGRFAALTGNILSDGNITREGEYSMFDNFEFGRDLLHLLTDNRAPFPVIRLVEPPEVEGVLEIDKRYTFSGASSSDPDGDLVNYTWLKKGDTMGYGEELDLRLSEPGILDIFLHVKDADEMWSHATRKYVVNRPPSSSFTATINASGPLDLSGGAVDVMGGKNVFFRSTSRDIGGEIVGERWDFGDGNDPVVNRSATSHLFKKKGNNKVVLTVWDNYGFSASSSVIFSISNAPPVVKISTQKRADEDENVHMSAYGSYDPNDNNETFFKNVTWDFGDGDQQNHSLNAVHTYRRSGIYNITLSITDLDPDDPRTGVAVAQIRIYNRPPKANASHLKKDGATITFTGANSTDTPSDHPSLRYHWSFGDGDEGEGKVVEHHFKEDGNFSVVLTVTDDDGANDTAILMVNITTTRERIINYPALIILIILAILLVFIWVYPRFKNGKDADVEAEQGSGSGSVSDPAEPTDPSARSETSGRKE